MTGREGYRNPPQQVRSQRLVELIIDTAGRLLVAGGPAALSTNAVADAAGISVGSLYRYFPHKEALVVAVIEREGRRLHDRISANTREAGATSIEAIINHTVIVTVRAYRSAAASDVLQTVELRQGGLFDRRHGALTAVSAALREAPRPMGGSDGDALYDTAPMLAEIIVALVEAATARPTAILSGDTVVAIACDAAIGYLARRSVQEKLALDAREPVPNGND